MGVNYEGWDGGGKKSGDATNALGELILRTGSARRMGVRNRATGLLVIGERMERGIQKGPLTAGSSLGYCRELERAGEERGF